MLFLKLKKEKSGETGNLAFTRFHKNYKSKQLTDWMIIESEDNKELSSSDLKKNAKIVYEAPVFLTDEGKEVSISHLFYVKLRNEVDVEMLEKIANKNNIDDKTVKSITNFKWVKQDIDNG